MSCRRVLLQTHLPRSVRPSTQNTRFSAYRHFFFFFVCGFRVVCLHEPSIMVFSSHCCFSSFFFFFLSTPASCCPPAPGLIRTIASLFSIVGSLLFFCFFGRLLPCCDLTHGQAHTICTTWASFRRILRAVSAPAFLSSFLSRLRLSFFGSFTRSHVCLSPRWASCTFLLRPLLDRSWCCFCFVVLSRAALLSSALVVSFRCFFFSFLFPHSPLPLSFRLFTRDSSVFVPGITERGFLFDFCLEHYRL